MSATTDTLSPSPIITEPIDRRHSRIPTRRRLAAAALTIAVLLPGCGSDRDAERDSQAAPGTSATPTASQGNTGNSGREAGDAAVFPQDCQPGVKNAQGLYCEVEQFGAPVFLNFENGTGQVGQLGIGQIVLVECLEPKATVPSAHGGWYKFALTGIPNLQQTSRKYGYAPANTFENGDVVGEPINRETNPHIPRC